MLFLINPLFLISFCCQKLVEQQAAPRTEVIMYPGAAVVKNAGAPV